MRITPMRQTELNTLPEGLDPDVEEVLRDPLGEGEIARLAQLAEHPELADPVIALLPQRKWSLRFEKNFFKLEKAALRAAHTLPAIPPRVEPRGQARLTVWLV